jgi:thiol-disulfide isomerase/thioredoxin
MRRWLTPLMIALALVLAAPARAAVRYQSDADLLRASSLPPSLGLILRGPDGERVSREEFFRKINEGSPFSQDGVIHIQRVVFTLGNSLNLEQPPSGQVIKLKVGDPIPSFHGTALDGTKVSNRTFRNRMTIVDFFGVDCGACIDEIPVLNAFKAGHPQVQTLAFTMDAREYVSDLVQRTSFKWKVAPDAINLVQRIGFWFAPTYALVDQRGRLLAVTSASQLHAPGKVLTSEDLARWVQRFETPDSPRH